MDTIFEMLITRGQHLLDRLDGSLHFRMIVMPIVVSVLAIRAGLRDARERKPVFLSTILRSFDERGNKVR